MPCTRLNIDYRWFDAKGIAPRYEFGYGLSYTAYEYSNLKVNTLQPASSYSPDEKAWHDGQATANHTGASLDPWYASFVPGEPGYLTP